MTRLWADNKYFTVQVFIFRLHFIHNIASEKSKQVFDGAMTHGYVEARDIKALIFGAAGTGKSHTIALLLDEKPPTVHRSTPCATKPIRFAKIEERDGKWKQFSQTIADTSTCTVLLQKPYTARNTTNSKPSSSACSPVETIKPKIASKQGATAGSNFSANSSTVSTSTAEDELLPTHRDVTIWTSCKEGLQS